MVAGDAVQGDLRRWEPLQELSGDLFPSSRPQRRTSGPGSMPVSEPRGRRWAGLTMSPLLAAFLVVVTETDKSSLRKGFLLTV